MTRTIRLTSTMGIAASLLLGGCALTLTGAVARQDFERVRELIAQGADVNTPNQIGRTPLILAAYYSNGPIAELLLTKNPDLNARDKSGYTALMYAVYYQNPFLVKLLLDHGADRTIRDKKGYTALDLAKNSGSTEIIALFKETGEHPTPEK